MGNEINIADAQLDRLIRSAPREAQPFIAKVTSILRRMEAENNILKNKIDELGRDREETFAMLFCLLKRETNWETFITLEEMQSMGLMEHYRIDRRQIVQKDPAGLLEDMKGLRVRLYVAGDSIKDKKAN